MPSCSASSEPSLRGPRTLGGVSDYSPPVRDIQFVLEEIAEIDDIAAIERFSHSDRDTVVGILEEAGRFVAEVVAPTNRTGDEQGSRRNEDGSVTTPDGFAEAYQQYVAAGWGSVPFEPEFGGGGFPWVVGTALQELLSSANMAFSICPLLTEGAIHALLFHGTPDQQAMYLPKMISGEWTGTMNLTEPDAGSDVGNLRARAEPADDGTWRLYGTKIFISYGEHDLTDNIVHLVLARTPGAPPGTKGISCFIVPKYLLDDDGVPSVRNDITCVSVEHKLGIHASPTCVLSYGDTDGAVGYLIGEENEGMRYMFTMMNNARLAVGLEGLALGERAFQQALAYAQERLQGRALTAAAGERSPIIDHPDVRRMLVTMKAYIEAMRALVYFNAAAVDRGNHHPDLEVRAAAADLAAMLIPVSKSWCTDTGLAVTSLNVQVHGGTGYIEETGVAQHFRDARIPPIYEGTNGIQAADLVGRKLPLRRGGVVDEHLASMERLDGALAEAGSDLETIRRNLVDGVRVLRDETTWLLEHGAADPNDALSGASPYLTLFGQVTAGALLAKGALAAKRRLDEGQGEAAYLAAKIATATFYAEQLMPQAYGLSGAIRGGADQLFAVEPKHLASS